MSLTGLCVTLRDSPRPLRASHPNTLTKHQNLVKRLARERAARIIAGAGQFPVRHQWPSANTDFGRAHKVTHTHLDGRGALNRNAVHLVGRSISDSAGPSWQDTAMPTIDGDVGACRHLWCKTCLTTIFDAIFCSTLASPDRLMTARTIGPHGHAIV
jgi:hypothetical protein